MNQTLKLKRGTKRTLTFTLYDSTDTAINLTGADVYLTIKRGDETPILDLGVCTLANQTTNPGRVTYAIAAATTNLLVDDDYDGEICVVDATTNVEFYPNNDTASRDYLRIVVSDSLSTP